MTALFVTYGVLFVWVMGASLRNENSSKGLVAILFLFGPVPLVGGAWYLILDGFNVELLFGVSVL